MQLTHFLKYLEVLISSRCFQNIYLPPYITNRFNHKQADFGSHCISARLVVRLNEISSIVNYVQ